MNFFFTSDFRVCFAMAPETGRWGLISLSWETAPCVQRSDIQRDNVLDNPFSVLYVMLRRILAT